MEPTNITVKILEQIRDSVQEVRNSVQEVRDSVEDVRDSLGQRIDQTNSRLDVLTDRVVEGEIRTATEIRSVAATLGDLKAMLVDRQSLRSRVDRCERDITKLKDHSGIK